MSRARQWADILSWGGRSMVEFNAKHAALHERALQTMMQRTYWSACPGLFASLATGNSVKPQRCCQLRYQAPSP
jgi:hypothetical protein